MNVVACPSCSKHLQYNQQQAGKQVRCPGCQTVMLLPGAPNPTLPADPLMGAPMQTPPTNPLMGAPMQTPPTDPLMGAPMQTPVTQPGLYGTQPAPAYPQSQTPRKKTANSNSKKRIILWSSIGGGGLLIVVIVLIFLFAFGGGRPFPVPNFFKEITLSEFAETPLERAGLEGDLEVAGAWADNYFFDAEGKSTTEIISYFDGKLPSYGWKKGFIESTYEKKSDPFIHLNIMISPRKGSKKLKVRIVYSDGNKLL